MSTSKRKRRLGVAAVVVAGYVAGTIVATRAGYRVGRNSFVRCRAGHLFTTTWIPGGSLKAIRLGLWRIQWCPVGRHVDLVRGRLSQRQCRRSVRECARAQSGQRTGGRTAGRTMTEVAMSADMADESRTVR